MNHLPSSLQAARRHIFVGALASIIAGLALCSASAQTSYTWTAASGGNFNDTANWSPAGLPSGTDIAVFTSNAGMVTFSSGTTNGSNLWVNNGTVELAIGTGNTLALTASQTVVLGATTSGTSSLTVSSGIFETLGNVRVGRGVFPDPAAVNSGSNSLSYLTVTGAGTQFRYQGNFFSGGSSGMGRIEVIDGGQLIATRTSTQGTQKSNAALQLGSAISASAPTSQLNVKGTGSVVDLGGSNPSGFGFGLIIAGPAAAGAAGAEVNVTEGGYLHTAGLRAGLSNGFFTVENKILVDGSGSKLRFERSDSAQASDNSSVLAYSSAARLTIRNNGTVEAANNLQIVGGAGGGAAGTGRDGTLEIIGSGSRYTAVASDGTLRNVTLGHASTPLQVATLRLAQGGMLDLSNNGTAANGLLTLSTTTSRIVGSGGTIRANVDNGGILSLGDNAGEVGTLDLLGDYTAQSVALHLFDIGGTAVSQYDRLTVSETMTLDGTVRISFASGFTASFGDSFNLISSNNVVGSFALAELPTLDGGLFWQESYLNGYSLSVVPEPSALLLGGLGAIGFGLFRLGRSRRADRCQ